VPLDTLYTLDEIAEHWRLSRKTLEAMAARGELPVVRIGRSVRVPASRIDTLLERYADLRCPVTPATTP
jgi:excisionase family DNA binding protein